MERVKQNPNKQFYRMILVVGIIFLAFNLRPAITSVGPLIGIIRDDVGLSNWSAGMLTSLPLIAFAIVSPIAPRLGNRYSNEGAMLIGLILIICGVSIRSMSFAALLFLGTLLAGVGIAVLNVLLPGIIKEKFPLKVGLMTSVYSTAMGVFAATASGVSIPIASGLGWGWNIALLIWVLPAIIGVFIWIYLHKKRRETTTENERIYAEKTGGGRMWRSPMAWMVALYMGSQSLLFYVTISWLPEILIDYGVGEATAGWMLSFMQIIGLPISFIVPVIAEKFATQWGIVIFLAVCGISGYTGLLVGNSHVTMVVSVVLIGIYLAGCFPLALAFLGIRAKTAKQSAELSGMAQSLGYILAAVGPIFIGYLFDMTHSWSVPLVTIIIVAVFVMLFGIGAGRNKYVLE